jgi:hypothetical protein
MGKTRAALRGRGKAPSAAKFGPAFVSVLSKPPAFDRGTELVRLAILSRLLVLSFGVISNQVVSDYDSSTALLRQNSGGGNASAAGDHPTADWAMSHTLDAFAHWDAVYFLRVAEFGYE